MKKTLSAVLSVALVLCCFAQSTVFKANAKSVTEYTESFENFSGTILSYSSTTEVSSEYKRSGNKSLKIYSNSLAAYSMNGVIVTGLDYANGTNSKYVIDLYYLAIKTSPSTNIRITPFVCQKTNPWASSVIENTIYDYVYKTDTAADGWQHATVSFDTTEWKYGAYRYFGLTLYPEGKTVTDEVEIYIDDISVTRVDTASEQVVISHGGQRASRDATEILLGGTGTSLPLISRGEDKFLGWYSDPGLSLPVTVFTEGITDIYASFETKPLSLNIDFEGNASEYNTSDKGTLSTDYAYTGNKSMKYTNTSSEGGVLLNLGKIEAGKTYLIGMYVKKADPSVSLKFYTRLGVWPVHVEYHNMLPGGGSREPSLIPSGVGGEFTYISFLTTMPDNLVSTCAGQTKTFDELYICSSPAKADINVYIDDVTVNEIRSDNYFVNVNNTYITPLNRTEKAPADLNKGILFYPEREGYYFDGWYLDSGFSELLKAFDQSVTEVFAGWTAEEKYTVSLDPNGGKLTSSNILSVEPNSVLNVPAPLRDGYIFLGWFDNNGDKISTVTKDVSLSAGWEKFTGICTAHEYDNDCDTTCNICGHIREIQHNTQDEYSFNATSHWKVCSLCNEKTGYAKHTYSLYLGKDAENHYKVCSVCGYKEDFNPHTDINGDGLCDICGFCSFCYGDANFDGSVNAKDLSRLKKHLAGATVAICGGADTTGDDTIDSKDLTRLKKHLAGLDVKLGPDDFGNMMILGDSYSTFEGYIPLGNATYYKEDTEGNNVSSVYETWWDLYANRVGANIIRNESWSGTTICNTGYNGTDASNISFIARIEKLISKGYFSDNRIDKLFILGGTNDSWAASPVGEPKYEGFTANDKKQVLPALCCIIDEVKNISPDTEIVLIINSDLSAEITDGQEAVAEHYSLKYLKLHDIEKQTSHPTVNGMKAISELLYEVIKH